LLKHTLNQKLLARLLKYFLLYFIIYFVISYFIRVEDLVFFSFASFQKMVVFASYMTMIFVMFDGQSFPDKSRFENAPRSAKFISNYYLDFSISSFVFFIVMAFPFVLILYIFFSNYRHEVLMPGKEIIKLLLYGIILTVINTTAIWILNTRKQKRVR
jgi:hypothetical protein